MKTVPLGPFLGMNNRLPDAKLHVQDKGDFVRNAVNVDITTAGTVKRRQGLTKLLDGDSCHSLFCAENGTAYYADGNNLYRVTGEVSAPVRQVVRSDLVFGNPLAFCEAPFGLLYSDGVDLFRLDGAISEPFGADVPSHAPGVSVSGGSLPGGTYQATYTLLWELGESGAYPPVQVTVPDGSSINLSAPYPNARFYLSSCNGEELFHLGDGYTASALVNSDIGGAPCQTIGMGRIPGGNIVRYGNGRVLVAQGSTLFYSEPFAPALFNPVGNWIPFPAPISIVEPIGATGTWVVADKTYWLDGGDVATATLVEKLPYGAAFGSSISLPDRKAVTWYSARGICMADGQGEVTNVQEGAVFPDSASVGAVMFREQDGLKQLVASVLRSDGTVAAASTFMEAEVIRKENIL